MIGPRANNMDAGTAASSGRDPLPRSRRGQQITLAHGGGGQLTDELVGSVMLPRLGNAVLSELLDSAVFDIEPGAGRLAMTIDGYVVQPLEFPGGDIGRLAVSGTINDLAVCGARPAGIALSVILAEGLDRAVLERVMSSVGACSAESHVKIFTGDTKVVGRDHADGIYITTSGVGIIPTGRTRIHPDQVRPGDVILLSGTIGDHGLAVMLAREMPDVKSALVSDVAPLNGLIESVLEKTGEVVFMRDPTRGGLAGLAADLAIRTGWNIELDETAIPVRPDTLHAAEMLGLDPLEVANEGKVVLVVRPDAAGAALDALRAHPLGRQAAVIGHVKEVREGICELITQIGGRRVLQKPYGEQLPRIC